MKLLSAFIKAAAFLFMICIGIFGIGLLLFVVDTYLGVWGYRALCGSAVCGSLTAAFYERDYGDY